MAEQGNNKVLGREDLKKHFRNGQVPTDSDFSFLIDSMINKQDDGFRKEKDNGMVISTTDQSKKLVTFLKNVNDIDPFFSIEKDEEGTSSMRFNPTTDENKEVQPDSNSFFFGINGSLGIGKRSEENLKLDVNGFVGFEGRIGTYKPGRVAANGEWQKITPALTNCCAFEIVARTGMTGSGKFAIIHAVALSAFGNSRSRIRKTSAHYGFFWNKLNLRFRGTTHNYCLELRTNTNYGKDADGKDIQIYYTITRLWDDVFLNNDDFFPAKKDE